MTKLGDHGPNTLAVGRILSQGQVLFATANLQQNGVQAVYVVLGGEFVQTMNLFAEGALDPGVLVETHAPPGVGHGMEAFLIDRQQSLDLVGRLSGLLINRRQRGHLFVQVLQPLVDFAGETFLAVDEEALFRIACGRHLDFDLKRQRLADFENGLELMVIVQHRP
ncbi:MAG: hypothetical protein V5B35_01930 [Candidatus Accumulibacter necessarius]